jgi:hypothetical protein
MPKSKSTSPITLKLMTQTRQSQSRCPNHAKFKVEVNVANHANDKIDGPITQKS